jgi:hypothetical protein
MDVCRAGGCAEDFTPLALFCENLIEDTTEIEAITSLTMIPIGRRLPSRSRLRLTRLTLTRRAAQGASGCACACA